MEDGIGFEVDLGLELDGLELLVGCWCFLESVVQSCEQNVDRAVVQ